MFLLVLGNEGCAFIKMLITRFAPLALEASIGWFLLHLLLLRLDYCVCRWAGSSSVMLVPYLLAAKELIRGPILSSTFLLHVPFGQGHLA